MNIHEREELSAFLKNMAIESGNIVKSKFQHSIVSSEKKLEHYVTNADLASESFIVENLKNKFPQSTIISEELGKLTGSDDYCWYIDPLDGTYNFLKGIPHFCISIALVIKNEIEVGVVYDPISNELFLAKNGEGAFLNGQPISVSLCNDLKKSFVGMSERSSNPDRMKRIIEITNHLMNNVHRIRIMGSTVLEMAWVACGRLDARIKISSKVWDNAAGLLLIKEAGGCVYDFTGEPANINSINFIASNRYLADFLFGLVNRV
jgi:myo-inositol-1(or 4)-monophosphatase